MDKRRKILGLVKNAVLEIEPEAEIILFGSRARKDHVKLSDWDFLILTDKEASEQLKENIRSQLYKVELETNQAISSIIHSKMKWERFKITPLYQAIQTEGVHV